MECVIKVLSKQTPTPITARLFGGDCVHFKAQSRQALLSNGITSRTAGAQALMPTDTLDRGFPLASDIED
jgi:hypothetical protein